MSKNNPLDDLLEAIRNGAAELPPVGSGAAVGDNPASWVLNGRDDCYYTDGVIARQVRTESVGRELRPAGINHGVVSVEVLPPVEMVEVSDGEGGTVWLEVTA